MLVMQGGTASAMLVALIRQNVRTPDQTMGDVWAQR